MLTQCVHLGGQRKGVIPAHVQRAKPPQVGDERGEAAEVVAGQIQLLWVVGMDERERGNS